MTISMWQSQVFPPILRVRFTTFKEATPTWLDRMSRPCRFSCLAVAPLGHPHADLALWRPQSARPFCRSHRKQCPGRVSPPLILSITLDLPVAIECRKTIPSGKHLGRALSRVSIGPFVQFEKRVGEAVEARSSNIHIASSVLTSDRSKSTAHSPACKS